MVAPPPRIPAPSPIPAAKIAGAGSASTSGAAAAGSGTGAGGTGNGAGGGGTGDTSRFTPAQLIRNPDSRRLPLDRPGPNAERARDGVLAVQTNGVPSQCRVIRSSGDPGVDGAFAR